MTRCSCCLKQSILRWHPKLIEDRRSVTLLTKLFAPSDISKDESFDDEVLLLFKTKHTTVAPMMVLSSASADKLQMPFDAVRQILSMTATPPPLPKVTKYLGADKFEYLLKLILVGDAGCGKSSFLIRFTRDEFSTNYVATIGVDFALSTIEFEKHVVKLQIWDLAGPERFRTITRAYYRGAHGVFMCYDVYYRNSFDNVRHWMKELETNGNIGLPILLVGLKADVVNIEVRPREVTTEEGAAMAAEYGIPFIECSAKDDFNMSEAVAAMVNLSIPYITGLSPPAVHKPEPEPKRKCCIC
eukprot:PhF_6_TR32428/c0_g1_i1/m.48128/K07874/RAB1A; Ras-related protein Rab-1A